MRAILNDKPGKVQDEDKRMMKKWIKRNYSPSTLGKNGICRRSKKKEKKSWLIRNTKNYTISRINTKYSTLFRLYPTFWIFFESRLKEWESWFSQKLYTTSITEGDEVSGVSSPVVGVLLGAG